MKRGILISILFVLVLNMISGGYFCSKGGLVDEDREEIEIGKAKSVNGLPLGLAKSNFISVVDRMEAELLFDAQRVILTNTTPSEVIEFTDEKTYNVSLVNSTENKVAIKIGTDTEVIEKKGFAIVSGLDVFLINSEGFYPGTPTIEILIGKDKLSLSSDNNPRETITFESQKYFVEIFSVTEGESAIIRSLTCENDTETIEYTAEEIIVENVTEPGETQNNTLNQINNETNTTVNNQTNETDNPMLNDTQDQNQTDTGDKKEGFNPFNSIFFYALVIFAILFFVLLFKYLKNKSDKLKIEKTEEIEKDEDSQSL
ncbi:MAG: hypothetical protein ABIH59_02095 [archaeon]